MPISPTISSTPGAAAGAFSAPVVQHFRQALLWPVRLMPIADTKRTHRPWQVLRDMGDASPWREEVDEYSGDSSRFHERHYNDQTKDSVNRGRPTRWCRCSDCVRSWVGVGRSEEV